MSRRLVYRIIYVPCLLALVGLAVTFAHPTRSAVTAKNMKSYEAGDKSFRIAYPAEWHKLSSSQNGTGARARFQRDANTEVIVTSDLADSLMLDLARNGNASGVTLPGMEGMGGATSPSGHAKTPLQAAHEMGSGRLQDQLRHYQEQPPTSGSIGGHDALISAFTAQTPDLFNAQELVGRRITILAGNHPVTVDAFCPKDDKDTFFATVDAMLKTLFLSESGG